jgi:hypothetical protein
MDDPFSLIETKGASDGAFGLRAWEQWRARLWREPGSRQAMTDPPPNAKGHPAPHLQPCAICDGKITLER